jgi:hypothetical protein
MGKIKVQFVHDSELLHGIFLDGRDAGAQFVHDSELFYMKFFPRLKSRWSSVRT